MSYEAAVDHSNPDLHAAIGLSLVLGFVVMLLIDQISARHNRGRGLVTGYYIVISTCCVQMVDKYYVGLTIWAPLYDCLHFFTC